MRKLAASLLLAAFVVSAQPAVGLPLTARSAPGEDPAEWMVAIDHSPGNPVPVDTPITVIVTVVDQKDVGVTGVPIDFLRTSDPNEFRSTTDSNGVSAYVFQGADDQCDATETITALVRDPTADDVTLEQLSIVVEYACGHGGPQGGIDGHSSANRKFDALRVWATWAPTVEGPEPFAGAAVDLYRKAPDGWHQVGGSERVFDAQGEAVFRVRDRNGREKNAYRAEVGPTAITESLETQVYRLR